MGSTKKTTTSKSSKKTKPTNSNNKNRTLTSKEVVTKSANKMLKKVLKKEQLTPTQNFVNQSKTAAKNKSFQEAFSEPIPQVSLEEIRATQTPKPAVRSAPFESFKRIGSLVPFRSFLPEGYVVFININSITSIQNYTTHTDTVQIGLSSGLTQLVRHSLSEVLEMVK